MQIHTFRETRLGVILIAYSSQKVKEGKIVKVVVELDDVIKKLKITGDFFLHPEDVLEDIEKSMVGLKKDVEFDTLVLRIHNIARACDAQMIGISSESIASVIMEAIK
jgi:lipoate-protein ligase A